MDNLLKAHDDQLEFVCVLDRQLAGFFALEDTRRQAAACDIKTVSVDGWHPALRRLRNNQLAMGYGDRIRQHDQAAAVQSHWKYVDGALNLGDG